MRSQSSHTLTWAIASLCAAWLVGVVCAVHVSTWQAPEALMVFGAESVWRGTTAGFRAVVRGSASHVPTPRTQLVAWLESPHDKSTPIEVDADDAAAWTMPVPAFEGEKAWLVVQTYPNRPTPPPPIKIPLRLVDGPTTAPMALTPLARHAPIVTSHAPGAEVFLVPVAGRFAVGLENPGIGLVQRHALPWRRLRVRSQALHLDTQTDDDGLFRFSYTPPLHPEPLRFVLGDDTVPTWVDLVPRVQVAQFQMLVPTRCFAQPDPLPLHIDTLPLKEPLAVDLWLENLLLGTTAMQVRERHVDVTLGVKAALPAGFLTVVAFRHVLAPGAPFAAARPMGATANQPVAALVARHAEDPWLREVARRTPEPSEAASAFALARVQPTHKATPLLYDDTQAVLDTFEQHRRAMHRQIYQGMGGLMGLSGAVIAVALWQMRRRLHRDVDAVLSDIAADELAAPGAAGPMTRLANRAYLVLAILALALACYGLLAVVMHLRWG